MGNAHLARALAGAVTALLLLGACSGDTAGSEEFCESARTFVTFDAETPLDEFVTTLEDMAATAPSEELAADAEALKAGLESAAEGDATGVESAGFEEAGDRIDAYASENCSAE